MKYCSRFILIGFETINWFNKFNIDVLVDHIPHVASLCLGLFAFRIDADNNNDDDHDDDHDHDEVDDYEDIGFQFENSFFLKTEAFF